MYTVTKRLEISASHKLKLSYESKCENLHGHNWIVLVTIKGEELNQDGMLMDFTHIKKRISDRLDHQNLNRVFTFNTTAENMAKWICNDLNDTLGVTGSTAHCTKVSVQESEGNIAIYEEEEI